VTVAVGGPPGFASLVRDIADFPKPGVLFKDITPLLADPVAFAEAIDALVAPYLDAHIDKVAGVEARGFLLAAPLALRLGAGLVPVRKAGKLPGEVERQEYALEYGTDLLEVHRDGIGPGERVLVVDDVLATGGTAAATGHLLESLGADVVGFAFLIELAFLAGRAALAGHETTSLIVYS